jgi:hypothetical protein
MLSADEEAGSDRPDMDLARQFLSDRQIYHFMASCDYVIDAVKTGDLDQQKMALIKKALPDCIHVMYLMMREVLINPVGANQAGRGTYVLIHIVGDSYSREHTIRDPKTGELESIKTWQISKLSWPKAAKVDEPVTDGNAPTKVFLHTAKGEADTEWKLEDGTFSETGKKAIEAVKQLLILLYQAKTNENQSDDYIIQYFKTFFKPKGWSVGKDSFYLPGTEDVIPLTYKTEFEENRMSTIQYDRYPRHVHQFVVQDDAENVGTPGFGYEYSFNFTPRSSQYKRAFFTRIPYGFFIGVHQNKDWSTNTAFLETMQLRTGTKFGLYFPFANAVIEPRLGYTSFLQSDQTYTHAGIFGADLTFNAFPDFFFRKGGANNSFRLSFGYEYLTGNLPVNHVLQLKLGLNTWQGRVVKR